jgi:DNA-binding NtrC family response regulator
VCLINTSADLASVFGRIESTASSQATDEVMGKDRILIVDDEEAVRAALVGFFEGKGFETVGGQNCEEAEQYLRTFRPDIAILDYILPDGNALDLMARLHAVDSAMPIIILTGYGSIELAVQAVKQGAEQFLTKPADLPTLAVLIQRLLENHRNRQKQVAERVRRGRDQMDPFLGTSTAIRKLSELAHKVVATDSSVLILGETGSGKGVLARWLHDHSSRAAEAFVDLNCGGFTRDLLETELFGHEKGAFTGAVQAKTGLLEIAHKGTVFLDEIGDVDIQVQPKLLKVLEEKQFRRLGDVRDRRVDIRLIAATHHDMTKLVQGRTFRSDLYFRISTIPLGAPSLRDRIEDIAVLANYFLERLGSDLGVHRAELSSGAIAALQLYAWPGNIRELRNVLERALLLSGNRVLTERDLNFDTTPEVGQNAGFAKTLEQVERQYIEEILQRENGRVEAAAKTLGIPRSSLYQKIKEFNIARPGASSHSQVVDRRPH